MSTPCGTQPRFALAGPGAVGHGRQPVGRRGVLQQIRAAHRPVRQHAMDMDAEGDLAMRLCGDLGIALTGDALWVNRLVDHDQDGPLSVPARRVTFLLPMNIRLCRQAELFLCYPEFNAKLRARLCPRPSAACRPRMACCGRWACASTFPTAFPRTRPCSGAFQPDGARLERQSAAGRASPGRDARLRLAASAWRPAVPGLGLSSALSPECLDAWLRADGNAWRSFSAATTRWSQPCSLAA